MPSSSSSSSSGGTGPIQGGLNVRFYGPYTSPSLTTFPNYQADPVVWHLIAPTVDWTTIPTGGNPVSMYGGLIDGGPDPRFNANFAARFTGWISIPSTGTYNFQLGSDDGSRLYIDNTKLLDNPTLGTTNANVTLSAGLHPIEVWFADYGGSVYVKLEWTPPSGSQTVVPSTALYYEIDGPNMSTSSSSSHSSSSQSSSSSAIDLNCPGDCTDTCEEYSITVSGDMTGTYTYTRYGSNCTWYGNVGYSSQIYCDGGYWYLLLQSYYYYGCNARWKAANRSGSPPTRLSDWTLDPSGTTCTSISLDSITATGCPNSSSSSSSKSSLSSQSSSSANDCPTDCTNCCDTYSFTITGTTYLNRTYTFNKSGSDCDYGGTGWGGIQCLGDGWYVVFTSDDGVHAASYYAESRKNGCIPAEISDWRLLTVSNEPGTPRITSITTSSCHFGVGTSSSSSSQSSSSSSSTAGVDAPLTVDGLLMWLDANSIAGKGNNDPITNWLDRTSNHINATIDDSHAPLYKTGVANGYPALLFDGSTQYLNLPDAFQSLEEAEIFIVFKTNQPPTGNDGYKSGLWYFGNDNNTHILWSDGNLYDTFGSNQRKGWIPAQSPIMQAWVIYNVSTHNQAWVARINGQISYAVSAINQYTTVGWPSTPKLGQSINPSVMWDGYIAEVVMFNRVVTDYERMNMTNYLSAKWLGTVDDPSSASSASSPSSLSSDSSSSKSSMSSPSSNSSSSSSSKSSLSSPSSVSSESSSSDSSLSSASSVSSNSSSSPSSLSSASSPSSRSSSSSSDGSESSSSSSDSSDSSSSSSHSSASSDSSSFSSVSSASSLSIPSSLSSHSSESSSSSSDSSWSSASSISSDSSSSSSDSSLSSASSASSWSSTSSSSDSSASSHSSESSSSSSEAVVAGSGAEFFMLFY